MKRFFILTLSIFFILVFTAACHKTTSWDSGDNGQPKILWGIGDEIKSAEQTPIFQSSPVHMITSWYNGPSDTTWMKNYIKSSTISDLYGKGYALELVVWLANEPAYAISPDFQHDAALLARIFRGNGPNYGPLYVVLFTEFETYSNDSTYFPKLKDAFLNARDTIKAVYPKAEVALGFGGYDWSGIKHVNLKNWEVEALKAGDFVAVQEMHYPEDVDLMISQVRNSVRQLGSYGKPVMISHFRITPKKRDTPQLPANAFDYFVKKMFNWQSLDTLAREGLFSVGFMNGHYINDPGPAYFNIRNVIVRHASRNPNLPGQ
ncbi:MAG TPA: hypothetical protein VKA08_11185 [Balneolales bacterium]|nr:hypothetical protein [Balneolales bacterium]